MNLLLPTIVGMLGLVLPEIKFMEHNNTFWKTVDGWFGDNDYMIYMGAVSRYGKGAKLAEVGVWKGRSLISILPLAKYLHYSQFVAVDTFKGSQSELTTSHKEATTTNIRDIFESNLKSSGYLNDVMILEMESFNGSRCFPDNYFDVIFIDAEHTFDAVTNDIRNWLPKLKLGGTLVGHDWIWEPVSSAVTNSLSGVYSSDNMWWYFKQN